MEDTWYKLTPQKENPVNRYPLRRKKTSSARHARHTARVEPKPSRPYPDGLPLSTSLSVCANGARTKRYERKSTNFTNTSIHIVSHASPPGTRMVVIRWYGTRILVLFGYHTVIWHTNTLYCCRLLYRWCCAHRVGCKQLPSICLFFVVHQNLHRTPISYVPFLTV